MYIPVALIILTVVWFIINPDDLLVKGKYFNVESDIIFEAQSAAKIEGNPNYNFVALANNEFYTTLYRSNTATRRLRQTDFSESIRSKIGGAFSRLYYDNEDNTYNFISYSDENKYFFNTIENNNELDVKSTQFYEYEIFNEVRKKEINIKDKLFYPLFTTEQADSILIIQEKEGYRLSFSKKFAKALDNADKQESKKKIESICEIVSNELDMNFTYADFQHLHKAGKRYRYYSDRFKNENKEWKTGFLNCIILGKTDCNNDGVKDYLLSFQGHRFVYTLLMAIDGNSKEIIWEKNFVPEIENNKIVIADIDSDGVEEIFLSFYSSCMEEPINHNESEIIGNNCISRFMILDVTGEIKEVKGKPLLLTTGKGHFDYRYAYNQNSNKLLMGLKSRFDNSKKKFIVYDLNINEADTLETEYTYIIDTRIEEGNYVFFDTYENNLRKLVFNETFDLIESFETKIKNGTHKLFDVKLTVDGQLYYLATNPDGVILISEDLKRKHYFDIGELTNRLFQINEDIYVISDYNLKKITISRNRTLNPYVIILFLAELMLLLTYFLIKQYVNIPMKSINNSYFVQYQILGRLHYWKLFGKLSNINKQHKRIGTNKETPIRILNELTDEYEEVYQRNFFLLKYRVFEIKSADEFAIIQRISHDLKNQVLMTKLMTEQYETKLHNENEKFMNNMSSSLHEISSSAGMLSNFSHINKLYKEEVILSSFINEFLKQYINHPLYDRIEFSPFTLSDSSSEESYRSVKDPNVRIDKALFTIALKNLINNALEAIDSKGYVKIKLNNNKAMITMEIKNSLHSKGASIQVETCMGIGYSTKETGSGLGIPISKSIIEKHGGTLEIETQENEFVVRIMLATN